MTDSVSSERSHAPWEWLAREAEGRTEGVGAVSHESDARATSAKQSAKFPEAGRVKMANGSGCLAFGDVCVQL